MLPYDTGKFHGIPVGADSISARKLCGCRYVPRATNGRPYRAVILLLFPMRTMRFPMYPPWG